MSRPRTMLSEIDGLLGQLSREVEALERVAHAPPPPASGTRLPSDVDALLREVAEAELACRGWPGRWPDEKGVDFALKSAPCRADWDRCYGRRATAITALENYAIRMYVPTAANDAA